MAISLKTELPEMVVEVAGTIKMVDGTTLGPVTLKINLKGITIQELARKACQQWIIDWRTSRKGMKHEELLAEVKNTTYHWAKVGSKVISPDEEVARLSPEALKIAVELAKAELAKEE